MSNKTERINVRCSDDVLAMLREAAELQGQDLTSFILGASLDTARRVLAEERVLRLSPTEMLQLERSLDEEAQVNPQLAALARAVNGARDRASTSSQAQGIVDQIRDSMTDQDREVMRTDMEDMYDSRGLPH